MFTGVRATAKSGQFHVGLDMDIDAGFKLLLKEFNRYVVLTDTEWEDIRLRWRLRSFRKNQIILAEGQVEQNLYFITEGVHRLYFLDARGAEQTVAFGYQGNFSGNLYSQVSQLPSHYFLEALSGGSMLSISIDELNELYDRYPIMDRWGRLLCQDFFVGRGKRERELMTMTAQERFHRLYAESPHLFQLVPHKHLASYIGMRPETFSRMWKSI